MIQITPQMRILLAVEPVDFRKGIDGRVALCRQKLQCEPLDGALFVFSSRRRTSLKILVYDGQGFWLCQKRLSQGRFRGWPQEGANPLAQRRRPAPLSDRMWDPIQSTLGELGPLEIRPVRRTPEEKLFGGLMEAHHYLAYTQPVGEHLKHLVYARGTPIAGLAWSSAPRHLGPRDRFIGWSQEQRRANIHLLAYNTRFLLLPWVKVPGLASHLLARVAQGIAEDWQQLYRHPVYLLETFIDPERFSGTCHRAANWRFVGLTTGRGKDDQTMKANRSLKQLWVLPLAKDFRTQLRGGHG
jgi:hypothetical protein